MRMTSALLATTLMLTASMTAFADINLRVVDNYGLAANEELWKKVKTDDVPEALVSNVTLKDPTNSYASLFPKAFYQEEDFLVCFKNCQNSDAKSGKEVLEQQTVYYWLSRFYSMARERLDLRPTGRVGVLTTREVRDPGSSKIMRNNAFFNPADGTLSFLPASSNPLAALLGAGKINRSGFDPSVVVHEAGHSLFHALFPHSVNNEISGLNEGFADYLANILLDKPQVGQVMLRGKTLRDSSSYTDSSNEVKIYKPGLEVHDLGERFAAALWLSRARVSDKEAYDRMVIDAVEGIAKNPFATGHSFKKAFLERAEFAYDNEVYRTIKANWEVFIPGEDKVYKDTAFLKAPIQSEGAFGLRTQTVFPESIARELGIKGEKSKFVYIKSVKTADNFLAHLVASENDDVTSPYWILIDPERGNALGAWYLDGTQVEESDIEQVIPLVRQTMSMGASLNDFITRAKLFSDLTQGKGDLRIAYKITDHTKKPVQLNLGSGQVNGIAHSLKLKRRLLARVLLGIPDVKSVTLTTAPGLTIDAKWPSLENGSIVGIGMELEDGTKTETFFEKVSL